MERGAKIRQCLSLLFSVTDSTELPMQGFTREFRWKNIIWKKYLHNIHCRCIIMQCRTEENKGVLFNIEIIFTSAKKWYTLYR